MRRKSLCLCLSALTVLALGLSAAVRCTVADEPKAVAVEPVFSPKKGQFRALRVGVNDYEKLNDLKFCEADVQSLRDQLIAMGFDRRDIKCLTTGDADPGNRPNYRNITERLDAMFRGLDEDAIVAIALSGHGGSFEWQDGREKKKRNTSAV